MSGSANKKYLDFVVEEAKNKILDIIANHYGISREDAYEEVVDEDAEYLFEYVVTNDRVKIFAEMSKLGLYS